MIQQLLNVIEGFIGSMLAFLIWIHWDLEGHWEHRRIEHGKKLEEKAKNHGK